MTALSSRRSRVPQTDTSGNEAVRGFRAADQIDEVLPAMSEQTETAILAGGCFWPAQQLLRHRDGVISTRVGYTGGENDNPTAHDHPGHAEAVEVIFDPERTRYRDILEFFFQIHRPDLGEELVGSDYRSEVSYTSEEQRRVA